MSLEASDVQTDEDCEELVEESFRFSDNFLEKKASRKRSAKPPLSPKSPYLTSLNLNPRRAAVAAWRLPRASLGSSREGTPGEPGSAHPASLSNGHDLSQTIRLECNVTPELFKQNITSKKELGFLHSASNGCTFATTDFRVKEDMYDEIIRLKKSLHAHISDNQQMKAKVRRLEDDNAKREKQIEELLDPAKGSEYTRSFVDKKKEGSVIVNGLKQRILKLEQQCREKESALSKLQSELRTTKLEELKVTVETYFEEIRRLKMLLDAAEKSSRAESKCSQRQQKALSSTVVRLSKSLKQVQQENSALQEELNTDSPAEGVKGYREWSKQRLLRRLLELEKRIEDRKRNTHSQKTTSRLDQEVQTPASEILIGMQCFTMATEAMVSVGTVTEGGEEESALRSNLSQLEREKAELHKTLKSRDEELRRVKAEREKLEKEMEEWKAEQTSERDKERQQHKLEMELLWAKIQTLEEYRDRAALMDHLTLTTPTPDNREDPKDRGEVGATNRKLQSLYKLQGETELCNNRQERAARTIQRNWREHRDRDVLLLQSALRGHLRRESQLKDLLKAAEGTSHSDSGPLAKGLLDTEAMIMLQSAFRGHLARSGPAAQSSGLSESSVVEHSVTSRRGHSPHIRGQTAQTVFPSQADSGEAAAGDSDDSDDIIVSPSRPIRRREVLFT